MTDWMRCVVVAGMLLADTPVAGTAQIDQALAEQYFKEARALCERDAGGLWGISLCGPIVIGDPITRSLVTSEPAPAAKPPAVLGFANAALDWGGTRWTTLSWPRIPKDERLRARLLAHELFHRIQPALGLLLPDGENAHLDTTDGRYWLQLEWRALAKALAADGQPARRALGDALAFRQARHAAFPGAAASERVLEINEGLAQYTGTVLAAGSNEEAVVDAVAQLGEAEKEATFVRTFPYPSGAAYGLLLDRWSPGWRRTIKGADDLARLAASAAGATAAPSADDAARGYGGVDLRRSETALAAARARRLADLRARFIDGPVVILPGSKTNSFVTAGMTPIPGAGTIYPTFRATAEWGTLEAAEALLATDRGSIRVPGPATIDGATVRGSGWTVQLAAGWVARPGARAGDVAIVRDQAP